MKRYDFIIVGAGSAGRTAAETLAEEAPGRSILLTDAEPRLPYKRTEVSKNVTRDFLLDEFAIHDSTWYADNGVVLATGSRAEALNPSEQRIEIDGETVGYGSLLLATGARPRIPFLELPRNRWSTLWTVDDARYLKKRLPGHLRLAVVGFGVLGIEAAWQATELGLRTTVVGRGTGPLDRHLDSLTSGILERTLEEAGVECIRNRRVTGIDYGKGELRLKTNDGAVHADFVVLAVGAAADTALAVSSGLAADRGILVDEALKTSGEGVWAAGDCAEHPGGRITGLWHSAEHQGRLAAFSMIGRKVVHDPPPFRLKCEVFGGTWFSAGPVNPPSGADGLDPAETWEVGNILWRPRFRNGILTALSGAAPTGMDKAPMKTAQKLLLEGADRETTEEALGQY